VHAAAALNSRANGHSTVLENDARRYDPFRGVTADV